MPNRVPPDQAIQRLDLVHRRLKLVSLDGETYLAAIRWAAEGQIAGGTIYDALIAKRAIASGARRIYSWNTRHFQRFGEPIATRLITPAGS